MIQTSDSERPSDGPILSILLKPFGAQPRDSEAGLSPTRPSGISLRAVSREENHVIVTPVTSFGPEAELAARTSVPAGAAVFLSTLVISDR